MIKKSLTQKAIYLFWYKLEEGCGNFGDELNKYIVEKLSVVVYKD